MDEAPASRVQGASPWVTAGGGPGGGGAPPRRRGGPGGRRRGYRRGAAGGGATLLLAGRSAPRARSLIVPLTRANVSAEDDVGKPYGSVWFTAQRPRRRPPGEQTCPPAGGGAAPTHPAHRAQ